jgi:hypothetical protein
MAPPHRPYGYVQGVNGPPGQISHITHLRGMPNPEEAHKTLQRLASFVAPLLRQHNTSVGELHEFYPTTRNLLGEYTLLVTSR